MYWSKLGVIMNFFTIRFFKASFFYALVIFISNISFQATHADEDADQ